VTVPLVLVVVACVCAIVASYLLRRTGAQLAADRLALAAKGLLHVTAGLILGMSALWLARDGGAIRVTLAVCLFFVAAWSVVYAAILLWAVARGVEDSEAEAEPR
jgi:hypothetical protein